MVVDGGQALQRLRGGDRDDKPAGSSRDPSAAERMRVRVASNLLKRTASVCRERDMFFHVVLLMTTNTDAEAWHWPPLSESLSKTGIPVSSFQSRRFPRTDLWLDGHLSSRGHRALARHFQAITSQTGAEAR